MKIRSFLMIFALASTLARTGYPSFAVGRQTMTAPTPYKIAILGDEHVAELGPLLAAKAAAPDTWLSGTEVRFEAHPGSTAADWSGHDAWGLELQRWHPDTVVIVLGTNDGMTNRAPADLLDGFQRLNNRFTLLAGASAPTVIWANPPQLPGSPRLEEIRALVGQIKGLNGNTYFFDPRRALPTCADQRSLTPEGYRLWAQALAKLL